MNRPRTALLTILLLMLAVGPAAAGRAGDMRVEAVHLLDEGVAAYHRMDYPLAVEKLRKCAGIALNSARAYYYLGLALSGDRRYHDAETALAVALDLDATSVQTHIALGDALLKEGDPDEATASFERALELRAEYPGALDGMARVEEARSDDERAIDFYRRAIGSNRGFAEAYVHLGSLFLRLDRCEEAVGLLREAVSVRSDFAPAYDALAIAYRKLGLESDAVATIRRAIELEPRSPDHYATLGSIELQMGLAERAEVSFHKAVELDPSHPGARSGLAEVARRRGDFTAALEEIKTALADPRIEALPKRRLEETKAALEAEARETAELEARIAAGGAPPETIARLAALEAGRRRFSEAADRLAAIAPSGAAREPLAYYLLEAGRNLEAHDLYADLAKETPRADLEVNAGVALTGLGDPGNAAAAYRRALALDPAHAQARLYLANALFRLGRRDEAIAAYKKYLDDVPRGAARARVVRILRKIAPDALPPEEPPSNPPGMGALPSAGS